MRPFTAFLAAVAGLAVLPSAVVAQNTTIHACANNNNGKLRVVADASQCNAREGAIELAAPGGPPALAPRFQLVGFTSSEFVGRSIGGTFGSVLLCQAEFPGSRMCAMREVAETTVIPSIAPGRTAWVWRDTVGSSGNDCAGWQDFSGHMGSLVGSNGASTGVSPVPCEEVHPIACCAPVP